MLSVVNYHYVRRAFDAPHEGIHGLTTAEFDAHLEHLGRVGSFVSPEQVRRALHGAEQLPECALLVTFDDGLREQVEEALPILERRGIPALFFVSTQPIAEVSVATVHKVHLMRSQMPTRDFTALIERQAAAEEIVIDLDLNDELAIQYPYDTPDVARLKYLLNSALPTADAARLIDGCFNEVLPGKESAISEQLYMDRSQVLRLESMGFLGTHGHRHVPLGLLTPSDAAREIASSIEYIHEWTGSRPVALSYPYGSKSACAPFLGPLAGAQGIELAFTMERTINHDFDRPLFLGRFDAKDVPSGVDAASQLLFDRAQARPFAGLPA